MLGQRRLLKWSIPGLAHFFTMWGFFILLTVYIEAYGLLFQTNFHIPFIGRWDALGFLQDFFATAVFLGIATFAIIRLTRSPREIGRSSRFYGSHTGGAWLILFMIFNVIWTYVLVRGSAVNNGTLPYGKPRVPLAASSARSCARSATPATKSWKRWPCFCTSASCWRSW